MSSDSLRRCLTERFLGFDFFFGVYFRGSGGDGCNNSCWDIFGRHEVELAGHSLGSPGVNPQVIALNLSTRQQRMPLFRRIDRGHLHALPASLHVLYMPMDAPCLEG
uniref:Uncharacterized protein n=1 Tax=Chromera velia CCMP2878 TaxID=1169474 RepID=A0A0G4G530_9ALVE|eukprot:Cvel_20323.t1-p1 / transcript=Cvel_20323.t1 / gene=Cvel_20323 / organism=Chromera_velia_CCMP2878 / gene_product=hypothetical protein / transcript_product=hypothetical protein / location=Cvel_scaffold1815:31615-33364(-) / protein_length=106 / sequence_SO=supercontig / SO=protein_coding / is_pseudo=false